MMNTKSLRTLVVGACFGCLAPGLALAQSTYEPYTFNKIAGKAADPGSADGTNSAAQFNAPSYATVDSMGNLYVADWNNCTIRKMVPVDTNWVVTTLAGEAGSPGSADGTGSGARFGGPSGITMDSAGNLYVVDGKNQTIRKMAPVGTDWEVTTLAGQTGSAGSADGTGSDARFDWPAGVTVDPAGNLYVADSNNNAIRKLAPVGADWVVTTLAGQAGSAGSANGTNRAARLDCPTDVAVERAGNLYVADLGNGTIRKVTPMGTNWVVTTLTGKAGSFGSADGTNGAARFYLPCAIAVDRAGNLYVMDGANNTIRKVTPVGTNWVVTTLAGKAGSTGSTDGTGSAARFRSLDANAGVAGGVTTDRAGNLYVAEFFNHTIRQGYRPLAIVSSGAGFGFNTGQFGLTLTGPAGQTVVLDASPDLVNWESIWTNTFMVGALQFTDPNSGVYTHRFYRAQRP